jgi:MFS family permease
MNKEMRTVLILSIIIYLVMTGVTIISPILPAYAGDFGADWVMVGVLMGSFAAARVFLSLPAGVIGDRIGNKIAMSIGLVIIIVSSVIAYFAYDLHELFGIGYQVLVSARIFEGIGSAFYATMSTSYLAKNTKIEKRGFFMGIFVGALLLGMVTGPGIGGLVAVNFGNAAPFLAYAIMTAIGFGIHIVLIKKDEGIPREELAQRDVRAEVKKVMSNRSFIIVNTGTLAAFFARGGIIGTIFPIMAAQNFGYDAGIIGLVLTGVALTSLVTIVPAGIIADKYGRKIPFTASMILGGVSCLFIPLAGDLYRTIGDAGFILGPLILTAAATLSDPNRITALPFVICFFWLLATAILLLKAEDPAGKKSGVGPVV